MLIEGDACMNVIQSERSILIDVIQLYKDLPVLWDHTKVKYNDKKARDQAYTLILEKYKVLRQDATIELVKKKLENMRAAYRREFKKVKAAKLKGEPEYRPSLWYYKYFTFLNVTSKYDNNHGGSEMNASEQSDSEEEITFDETNDSSTCDFKHQDEPKEKISKVSTVYVREQQNNEECQNYSINSVNSLSLANESSEPEAFGKVIGLQLLELEPVQRTIAEKLISDVIFYGRINALTLESSIHIKGSH
ncbi:unnamed protein product [Parnassius apollo]|uniref:(apollo) hypothetical protein n=1 Tax=Parnassius apollo TaxID=110799 RepID=A0A8S3XA30_PARAO|nr:unnamed protein product [Parnassius apollo]